MIDDMNYEEWRQEKGRLEKAPARGGIATSVSPYTAGVPIGNPGKPPGSPSNYSIPPRSQPNPWVDDVSGDQDLFSPQQPLWPAGPPNVQQPRQWDYPVGYNLNYVPARME